MIKLTDDEKALLARHKAERDAEQALEYEMANAIVLIHRPTVSQDLESNPGYCCAECQEPYPCRRVRWAQKRRMGAMAQAAQRLGNGHHPDEPGTA